jgi:hypothetical protein
MVHHYPTALPQELTGSDESKSHDKPVPIATPAAPRLYLAEPVSIPEPCGDEGRTRGQFLFTGMVTCSDVNHVRASLTRLHLELLVSSLHPSLPETDPATPRFDPRRDSPEVRSQVIARLQNVDFEFAAVVRDLRVVLHDHRDLREISRDSIARLLGSERRALDSATVLTAPEADSAGGGAWRERHRDSAQPWSGVSFCFATPAEEPGLQVADYCVWALQRCFDHHDGRFLRALWPKVRLLQDVDAPGGSRTLTREDWPPNPNRIKFRWL